MKFCGIKLTHDGAVAVIEDGRLRYSVESEKIANRGRYSTFDDLADVEAVLNEFGDSLSDMDAVAVDGWHKTIKVRRWRGVEVPVNLGPYTEPIRSRSLFTPSHFTVLDLPYVSFPHYASHVASAYCTSPFAARGEPSLIVSWDGLMYPMLYHCDGDLAQTRTIGPLFPLVGNAYPLLAGSFPPFADRWSEVYNLGLAGKVMAYAGLGTPNRQFIAWLDTLLAEEYAAACAESGFGSDRAFQLEAGVDRIRSVAKRLRSKDAGQPVVEPADAIASIDRYLGERLVTALSAQLDADPSLPRNVCLVGGTALNINWNRAIRDSGLWHEVWVPPFPNDSGAAIGSACSAMALHEGRSAVDWDVYAGPALRPTQTPSPGWSRVPASIDDVAQLLHSSGDPVVFLTGRAELGPRALGHRSILAPADRHDMHDRLNTMKRRESYRPIAPICLEAAAPTVFDPGTPDPYMLFNHEVRPEWLNRIPAVCHVDGTARLQTVNAEQEPVLHQLLTAYERLSGIPLLCNTSANFSDCGFFPDAESAMRWGQARYVYAEGTLYERLGPPPELEI